MDRTNSIFDRSSRPFDLPKSRTVEKSAITPGTIGQKHLESGLYAIKFGLAADRPTTPGEDSHYFAYFATDTFVLSMWTGSVWKTTTMT